MGLWEELHNYKHPKLVNIHLTLFWASNATADPAAKLVAKAIELLKPHNFGLNVYPATTKTAAHTLSFNEQVYLAEHAEELRSKANSAYYSTEARIPVIFAPFRGQNGTQACGTNGMTIKNTNWLPYILINSNLVSPDMVTLLHEIGHAADLGHMPKGKDDKVSNFMSYETDRTDMLKQQLLAIAKKGWCR